MEIPYTVFACTSWGNHRFKVSSITRAAIIDLKVEKTSKVFGTLFLVANFRILIWRWSNPIRSYCMSPFERRQKTRTKIIHGCIWKPKQRLSSFQEKAFVNWKVSVWCRDSVLFPFANLTIFLSGRLNPKTQITTYCTSPSTLPTSYSLSRCI